MARLALVPSSSLSLVKNCCVLFPHKVPPCMLKLILFAHGAPSCFKNLKLLCKGAMSNVSIYFMLIWEISNNFERIEWA
jgi:hypothetical protein